MSQAICVNGLHVRYPVQSRTTRDAVAGLSFNVEQGEIVGFLGPNGAGKSSTLKALMGFVTPTAGKCAIFGAEAGSTAARSVVGYLPEVAMYYPYLTPMETLTLYGQLQGLRGQALKREATELLERLGLGSFLKSPNRRLSKGMLQRVGIAQALLGNPRLLILDEVTSGLDPLGRQELRVLLRERRAAGATLFFSSHELSEVENLCDRILFIQDGRLVDERFTSSLQDELRMYSISYSGSVAISCCDGPLVTVAPGVTQAKFRSKEQFVKAIDLIWSQGGAIVDVVAQEGSLESYFIETMARAA